MEAIKEEPSEIDYLWPPLFVEVSVKCEPPDILESPGSPAAVKPDEESFKEGYSLAEASDKSVDLKAGHNYLCDRKEDCDVSPQSLVKSEPPVISKSSRLGAAVNQEMVPPVSGSTESLHHLYTTEPICLTRDMKSPSKTDSQPTSAAPTASRGDENFEFVSIEGIKREEPVWTSDLQEGGPNPLQEPCRGDQSDPLPQDVGPSAALSAALCQVEWDMEQKKLITGSRLMLSRTNSIKRPYQCEVCNKQFTDSSNLARHRMTHTREKPYRCDICSKPFTESSNLTRHRMTHTGEKPYPCVICNRHFTRLSNLTRHTMTHTGEKPLQCEFCDKRYPHSSALKVHRMKHTGLKPHKCDVCNKRFSQSSALKDHKMIHTGEKPYKCDVCSRQFTQSSTLKVHKMTHSGEKPFQCNLCKKRFTELSHLKVHKMTHSGDTPYDCQDCNKKFTQSSSLTRHSKIHTREHSC